MNKAYETKLKAEREKLGDAINQRNHENSVDERKIREINNKLQDRG